MKHPFALRNPRKIALAGQEHRLYADCTVPPLGWHRNTSFEVFPEVRVHSGGKELFLGSLHSDLTPWRVQECLQSFNMGNLIVMEEKQTITQIVVN